MLDTGSTWNGSLTFWTGDIILEEKMTEDQSVVKGRCCGESVGHCDRTRCIDPLILDPSIQQAFETPALR